MSNNITPIHDDINVSGGGGGDDMIESRVAKLEAVTESTDRRINLIEQDIRSMRSDMRSDFRTTWAGLFVAALGLAGLMAKGFNWI